MQEIYKIRDALQEFPDIKTEIIGNWLWITGNTKAHMLSLKMLKCNYCSNKKCWVWHEGKYIKRTKNKFSLDDIRQIYTK